MGVRTLTSYVLQHNTTKELPFSSLKNKTIAVDTSVFLYEWLKLAAKERIEAELKGQGIVEDQPSFHWEWHCVRSLDSLRKYKIKLIFLFEESHPEEKNQTVKDRQDRKLKSAQHFSTLKQIALSLHTLLSEMEAIHSQYSMRKARENVWKSMTHLVTSQAQNSVKAQPETYDTCKKIIEAAGLRWMNCESEAEYVAVDMEQSGLVDYVMSNDSDCIACLCKHYISNLNWDKETFSLVNVDALIRSLRITPEQFQIACCCIGNDYLSCLLRPGIYWNAIRHELRRLHLYTRDDMMTRFEESRDTLEFCWNLYSRVDRKSIDTIHSMMCGDGRVSPRFLHTIRMNGVCV